MKSPVHLLRIVYTVHTDFHSRGTTCDAFDQEDDAYRHAATIAYANFETQRNFSASHKRRLRHLWQKEDYFEEYMLRALKNYLQEIDGKS